MTACKEYTGSINFYGYGIVWNSAKKTHEMAHRIAYCKSKGIELSDIKGLVVRHTCDNPPCVNPEHLLIGTQGENMRDMVERGRCNPVYGEDNYHAKLTAQDVTDIRRRYKPRCRVDGCRAMAREFGVCHKTIGEVVHNTRWRRI